MSEYQPAFDLSPAHFARRRERDKRDHYRGHYTHANGLCGGPGAVCGECFRDQHEEMIAWARTQPDPEPGESTTDYWRRIRGPFYDSWHSAARARGAL